MAPACFIFRGGSGAMAVSRSTSHPGDSGPAKASTSSAGALGGGRNHDQGRIGPPRLLRWLQYHLDPSVPSLALFSAIIADEPRHPQPLVRLDVISLTLEIALHLKRTPLR